MKGALEAKDIRKGLGAQKRSDRAKALQMQHATVKARSDALRRAKAKHKAIIRRARVDPVAFNEYVLLDEQTQRPIRCAPIHREWHHFLNDNPWAVLIAPVEHGKTAQIAVGRLLFELGRNPDVRIAVISEAEDQAKKIVGALKTYIEESERLHEVFPKLRRSRRKGHRWNQLSLDIDTPGVSRDASVKAYGSGSKIVGSRLDIILCDDILGKDNTSTPAQSAKLLEYFETSVFTRAQDSRTGTRARLWVVGTPWAEHDLLHTLEKRTKVYATRRFCCVENPDDKPAAWRPTWTEAWPLTRLLMRLNGMLPGTFARKYLCRVVNDIMSRFPAYAIAKGFALGKGVTFLKSRPLVYPGPRELPCWTGVDLGIGEKEENDLTALVTVALRDDMKRQIVNIESGRWTADEIVERIVNCYHTYGSRIVVESNAAQRFLTRFTRVLGKIPVDPFMTGVNKWDEAFGVESIAVELRQGFWALPSGHDGQSPPSEMQALRLEMSTYRPEEHTGDRLMALWMAREAMRGSIGRMARDRNRRE